MILNQIPIYESLWHHITPISRSKRLFAPQTTVRGMFPASVRRRTKEGRRGEAVKAPPRKSTNAPQYTAQYKRLFFPPSFPRMQGVRALLSQVEIDQISPLELKNEPLTPFEILHNRSKSLQCGLHNAAPAHMLSAAAARAATTKTASPTSLVSAAEQSSLNGWMDGP